MMDYMLAWPVLPAITSFVAHCIDYLMLIQGSDAADMFEMAAHPNEGAATEPFLHFLQVCAE